MSEKEERSRRRARAFLRRTDVIGPPPDVAGVVTVAVEAVLDVSDLPPGYGATVG